MPKKKDLTVNELADHVTEITVKLGRANDPNCEFWDWLHDARETISDPFEFRRQMLLRPEWLPFMSVDALQASLTKYEDAETREAVQHLYADHLASLPSLGEKTAKRLENMMKFHGDHLPERAREALKTAGDKSKKSADQSPLPGGRRLL